MSNGIDSEKITIRRHAAGAVRRIGFFAAFAVVIALMGCGGSDDGDASTKVNGSIHVSAGKPPEAVSTVNGSIHIDDNAAVTSATTVNGGVHLGSHATAASLNVSTYRPAHPRVFACASASAISRCPSPRRRHSASTHRWRI